MGEMKERIFSLVFSHILSHHHSLPIHNWSYQVENAPCTLVKCGDATCFLYTTIGTPLLMLLSLLQSVVLLPKMQKIEDLEKFLEETLMEPHPY